MRGLTRLMGMEEQPCGWRLDTADWEFLGRPPSGRIGLLGMLVKYGECEGNHPPNGPTSQLSAS